MQYALIIGKTRHPIGWCGYSASWFCFSRSAASQILYSHYDRIADPPAGVDTVIMQENTQLVDNAISFTQPIKPASNIRFAGEEDIRYSTRWYGLDNKPQTFCHSDIPCCIIGSQRDWSFSPVESGYFLYWRWTTNYWPVISCRSNLWYQSADYTLNVRKMNCQVIDLGIITDEPDKLYQAFEQADLVISSGGVSVGEADYTKQILNEISSINFGNWQSNPVNHLPLVN